MKKIIWLLIILLSIVSCDRTQDPDAVYEFKAGGFTNRQGAGSIQTRILRGEDPASVINGYMSGPTEGVCPPELSADFVVPSEPGERPLRGRSILDFVNNNYPKNCRYVFQGWSNSHSQAYRRNVDAVIAGRLPNCHVSNCSTASFLTLIEAIKGTKHEAKLKGKMRFGGPLYQKYVIEPNMIERVFGPGEFNLGSYQKINRMDEGTLRRYEESGWPSAGDFVTLNRRNGSGHSVVFSHYQGSGSGRKVCYWSSNKGTNGMGMQCERTSRMGSMHVGRVE